MTTTLWTDFDIALECHILCLDFDAFKEELIARGEYIPDPPDEPYPQLDF